MKSTEVGFGFWINNIHASLILKILINEIVPKLIPQRLLCEVKIGCDASALILVTSTFFQLKFRYHASLHGEAHLELHQNGPQLTALVVVFKRLSVDKWLAPSLVKRCKLDHNNNVMNLLLRRVGHTDFPFFFNSHNGRKSGT